MLSLRLPRFARSPEVAPIQLTKRDRLILRLVHQHRFLRSTHLIALLGDSSQQVLRRLQLLYHHGYLERPRAQIGYYERGSRPMVYGLANKGAALLKREQGLAFHELNWGEKNRSAGRMFLEHSLLVSDVMVALEIACRKNGRVRLLTGKELPLPESLRAHRQPFKWTVTAKKIKLGVIPDAAFVLEFLDRASDRNRVLFFLEADCGTMPATRASLAQSSFYRKLLTYESTWAQELHRHRFGFNRFRVIAVTHSPARVTSLVQACRQLSRGHGLFLFIDIPSLIANPDLLTLPFQTGHGGKVATLVE